MKFPINIDIDETVQVLAMRKRGHFTYTQLGYPKKGGESKGSQPKLKKYKSRRASIKRGDAYGVAAKFGAGGCSSYYW